MFFKNEVTYVFTCPLEIYLRPWCSPYKDRVKINTNAAQPYEQKIRDEIFDSLCKSEPIHDLIGPLTGENAHADRILLPSVVEWGNEFTGIASLTCEEEIPLSDLLDTADYLKEEFKSGWGAGFFRRGIATPLGELYVKFGSAAPYDIEIIPCF